MRSKEKTVNKCAHIPGPSSHTEKLIVIIIKIMINIELWIIDQYFAGKFDGNDDCLKQVGLAFLLLMVIFI